MKNKEELMKKNTDNFQKKIIIGIIIKNLMNSIDKHFLALINMIQVTYLQDVLLKKMNLMNL